jgi:hypothetical protein
MSNVQEGTGSKTVGSRRLNGKLTEQPDDEAHDGNEPDRTLAVKAISLGAVVAVVWPPSRPVM